ncbi:hypothetical protein E4U19_005087 [Claviceps sp. Clav32 group G5]|nr:hypothetical protein E4U19_005087 [Claviceps sp. Clav32 group G5]
MVQIKSLMVAVIVAVAPVAQAGTCTPGLDYCAATLVRYGKKKQDSFAADRRRWRESGTRNQEVLGQEEQIDVDLQSRWKCNAS